MTILAFGLSHSSAPVEIRERVVFSANAVPQALDELRASSRVSEVAILSTCNRTEIYCRQESDNTTWPAGWLSGFHGLAEADLRPYLYTHPDAGAVKHVLRVASGLDSMILGEPQVLGQLKNAYQTAMQSGSIGQTLGRLFQHSFHVAKEIRSNTAIGSHPVSVAFAAVRLARQIFGDLAGRTALLVGAGETIELTARHLADTGLQRMIIANRSLDHAARLAQEFSAYGITLGDLPAHLYEADIIFCSTASPEPVIDRAMVADALQRRRHRPIFIVDIAVPRDVEPAAGELDDVYLYTVDDLQEVIDESLRTRKEAARQAEQIIDAHVLHFMQWMESRDAVSTIRALRDHAVQIQADVLRRAQLQLRRGDDPERVVQEVARLLTNKLMHAPSAQLRNSSADDSEIIRFARQLFDLADPDQDPG